ncbi:DNA phosphorothioation-associated protein 4 [Spongiactinospora sp. 9N601]|uniref:DNA phosphorothioation-associated protein 4 n=1 Tax=Spongiactinospora sp. 9N601 TaxID=3375149 RepID=UPI00379B9E7B
MVLNADLRVRRPQEHEELIGRLTTKEGGPFPNYWQVLVFAAALGWARGRREPFDKHESPIRYGLFNNSAIVSATIDSMAVLHYSDDAGIDAGIMAEERLPERIRVFEEYANGGLLIIQGELNSGVAVRPTDVILNLCRRGMTQAESRVQDILGPRLSDFGTPDFES